MNARKSKNVTRSNPRPARKVRKASGALQGAAAASLRPPAPMARVPAGKKLSLKAEAERLEDEGLIRLLREKRKIKGPVYSCEEVRKHLGLA